MSCKFIYIIKTISTARQYQAMCMNVSLVLKYNRKCILYNTVRIYFIQTMTFFALSQRNHSVHRQTTTAPQHNTTATILQLYNNQVSPHIHQVIEVSCNI